MKIPDCPTCGAKVRAVQIYDRAEGSIAEPCRHRVEVTVWPTRIDLEEPS